MLHAEVIEAKLSPSQYSCFRQVLKDIAYIQGRLGTMETRFIDHLFKDVEISEARSEINELWGCSELVLTSAVTVSVLSGRYPIEQARRISRLAHQFGYSARKLRILENQALRAIHYKGQQINEDMTSSFSVSLQNEKEEVGDVTIRDGDPDHSYSDFMQGLWRSDADLIEHTQYDQTEWESEEESH
jgi:hypothetical protein